MKITAIRQQVKRGDRYSIFVDEKYAFSLSEPALLEQKLVSGQEISDGQLKEYKQLSADDKLYHRALRYASMRMRTAWEIQFYLARKQASPALADIILNKLSIIGLIDDAAYAKAFVHDRTLLRPTSRRKLILELRKKHVPQEIIQSVLGSEAPDEQAALQAVISQKRRQTRYHDDVKLMQYLARQGFTYSDIKAALNSTTGN